MDTQKLQGIAQSNDLARIVFNALAQRERPRPVTDLSRLRTEIMKDDGIAVNLQAFLQIFKQLQELGMGTFINPNPKIANDHFRFKWRYDLREIGKRAIGATNVRRAPEPVEEEAPPSNRFRVTYPFRGGVISFDLPQDITKKETAELADFIRRFGK